MSIDVGYIWVHVIVTQGPRLMEQLAWDLAEYMDG